MGSAELNGQYQRLRNELDEAYAGPVWNSSQIDRIAAEISEVEFALATAQHGGTRTGSRGASSAFDASGA